MYLSPGIQEKWTRRKYATAKIKKNVVNATFSKQLESKSTFLEISSRSIITQFQITQ
jgi:hypothetical protein